MITEAFPSCALPMLVQIKVRLRPSQGIVVVPPPPPPPPPVGAGTRAPRLYTHACWILLCTMVKFGIVAETSGKVVFMDRIVFVTDVVESGRSREKKPLLTFADPSSFAGYPTRINSGSTIFVFVQEMLRVCPVKTVVVGIAGESAASAHVST